MVMKHVDWHIFNGTMALIVTFLQKSESLIQSRKWRKKVFSVKGALNIEGHQIPSIEKVIDKERKGKDGGLVVV